MDPGPLVDEQIDAGAEFVRQFGQVVPLKAAFWVKLDEDENWSLWIASEQIKVTDIANRYGDVSRVARALHHPWLTGSDVKLAKPDDRLVDAVLQVQKEYPGRWPMRLSGRSLKGASVEQLYIYEVPVAVAG